MYYWSLGDVSRGSNKLEDARRYYKLALQLDPKDSTAPVKLGHVKSFLGNFDEARKDYDSGMTAGGAANAGFLGPFKSSRGSTGRAERRSARSKNWSPTSTVRRAGPDQRLNAQGGGVDQRCAGRAAQRPL